MNDKRKLEKELANEVLRELKKFEEEEKQIIEDTKKSEDTGYVSLEQDRRFLQWLETTKKISSLDSQRRRIQIRNNLRRYSNRYLKSSLQGLNQANQDYTDAELQHLEEILLSLEREQEIIDLRLTLLCRAHAKEENPSLYEKDFEEIRRYSEEQARLNLKIDEARKYGKIILADLQHRE
jgi:hypothetical protein